MITGKNKERFEEYVTNVYFWDEEFLFSDYPFEMQQGVYLAYYVFVKAPISIDLFEDEMFYFKVFPNDYDDDNQYDNQNEALTEAFKQADKLENEKH
tara:strand:- start:1723 stop:2013 length:291 start_codon:yes stop_codon:yes gene_type:complete